MNNPVVIVIFLSIMSLLVVTLFDLQDEHRTDMEAQRVAEIIRGVAQLQQAHYQTSNAVDPAGRFLTRVKESGVDVDTIPAVGTRSDWDWFHSLPDDPVNKTYDDDKNRFSTWATRRWLRDSSGALDNSGLPPFEDPSLTGGTRSCCVVDPGSVQVIYEARDAHVAGLVARQFGPSACLGRPQIRTGVPLGEEEHWLSYECAEQASANDRYAIVHFSAPSSLTIVDGMVWKEKYDTNRPLYGDIVLRRHRPQGHELAISLTGPGSTLYASGTSNPITASISEGGYLYARGTSVLDVESHSQGRRIVSIDSRGNLRVGFSYDDQVTLNQRGLELKQGNGSAPCAAIPSTLSTPGTRVRESCSFLGLTRRAGTRTLSGVESLRAERAKLDVSDL